jgi:protein gp37
MSGKTKIEWASHVWNPVRGCSKVSSGCKFCYAERMAARNLPGLMPNGYSAAWGDRPYAESTPSGPRWTGRVELIGSQMEVPLHWRKPHRIFVCSMSDAWHEKLHLRDIARIYAVAAIADQHTYMILTKRPGERRAALTSPRFRELVQKAADEIWEQMWADEPEPLTLQWPLPNIWEGVSVEDQATADERIPLLLQTPAAVRFVSLEPMLGPVDIERGRGFLSGNAHDNAPYNGQKLDWIILGGESGPGARAMNPAWARSVRDQSKAAGVPFFFKGWGEWGPTVDHARD